MTDPYAPPTSDDASPEVGNTSNPARILLYLLGVRSLLLGIVNMPTASRYDTFSLFHAVFMLAFGISAIWLGHRRYDRFGRRATMTLGFLGILTSPSIDGSISMLTETDIPFYVLFLMSGTIYMIAFSNRPNES